MTKHLCVLLIILLVISPYLTSGAPAAVSILLPADELRSTYYCSDSPDWCGPSFYPKNCATAMAQFFVQELLVHGDAVFEFLAAGGRAQSRYPSQKLPEKFTYGEPPRIQGHRTNALDTEVHLLRKVTDLKRYLIGTCTMAVVMLASFHPEELPGVPPSRVFTLTDVASYSDIWAGVKRVMDNCISEYVETNKTMQASGGGLNFRSQTGWSAIGTLRLPKIFGESLADVEIALQGVKAILVSSYGTQIRKSIGEHILLNYQLTACNRATHRCS